MKSYFGLTHLWKTGCVVSLAVATAFAADPVVKTVPWVASNELIPHTTWSGKSIRLKGTCDQQGPNLTWFWDFGDGSAVATGTVTNKYAIEASHAYTGAPGTVFTARLTVNNTTTGENGNKAYYVVIQNKTLDVEVNVAIDEGLWYLHKTQYRVTTGGIDYGDWYSGSGYATLGQYGVTCANVNAFEVNGHLETGAASNPYTETVRRGLRRIFTWLTTRTIGQQTLPQPWGTVNPDSNGNGYAVYVAASTYYQGGMFMDVIVATGTPTAITTTGSAPSGSNPGILGRTYAAIVQDMVDDHAWAQYDYSPQGGGWRYSPNQAPDNSACQWAAIGLIAAERSWGLTVPTWVKGWNVPWLKYTQTTSGANAGAFGYTAVNEFPWGLFATTPSGMVQMVMDGIGRGGSPYANSPSWQLTETLLRDRFLTTGSGYSTNIKDYYYGLFSFVKAMLLHRRDTNGDGSLDPDPIVLLQSQTAGVAPVDWYSYEGPNSSSPHGVARTLVNDQNTAGYWFGHNPSSEQQYFETAWAIMMLHRTLFESGVPVAVAKAIPNPAVVGQTIVLDGSDSYHQDPAKSIDSWQWDLDNNGVFEVSGPFASVSFPSVGSYLVKLRVTDGGTPEQTAETVITVRVTTPPIAPTADAGGPYYFCDGAKPWFLDGSKSRNPDEGQSEPGIPPNPGDRIQSYEWDLDGDGKFDDDNATGMMPNVTAFFTSKGPGTYLIYLKVTDTTAVSYPSSRVEGNTTAVNLTSVATAEVVVLASADPLCVCVKEFRATSQVKAVALSWEPYPGCSYYNVYRSQVSGGPYLWIGAVSASSPPSFVDDQTGAVKSMFFYVVRPAAANGDELCQSNQASAEPLHPPPVVSAIPTVVSNTGKYYYTLKLTSESFGRNQVPIYIGDTADLAFKAGPYFNDYLVYIRTNLASSNVRSGTGTVKGYIMTKGSAKIWAEDPLGQVSNVVIIP